jgi:FkbM family methyltransferase
LSTLESLLSPGDGVLDIGANVGEYAERYAKAVGPTGSVLAIEPDPVTAEKARARLKDYRQVTVMAVAVARGMGRTVLHRDTEPARNSLIVANLLSPANDSLEVDAAPLDWLAGMVNNLKAIKIDAQGMEWAILQGATETLTRREIAWYIEIWPQGLTNAGSSAEAVIDLLEANGLRPEEGWAPYRAAIPTNLGHSAMDALVRHTNLPGSD